MGPKLILNARPTEKMTARFNGYRCSKDVFVSAVIVTENELVQIQRKGPKADAVKMQRTPAFSKLQKDSMLFVWVKRPVPKDHWTLD